MLIKKSDARKLGLKKYFTGRPCRRGHIAERYISTSDCVQCVCSRQTIKYENNREEILATLYRFRKTIGSRIGKALKQKKSHSITKLLGVSIQDAKQIIESKFQPGMTWENWSKDGWHLDHIRPLASFDLTDPKQLAEACHISNLQLLWAEDNLSKGAKWQTNQQ